MKLAIVLVVELWCLTKCTAIGYMAGSGIDKDKPDYVTLRTCGTLEQGDDVRVFARDGTAITGTITGPNIPMTAEQKQARITGSTPVI
jgi:hypothetical protein